MTAGEPNPQEHCGHECVCAVLAVGGIEGDRSPCDFTGCKHDTRSHSSSPAAAPVLVATKEDVDAAFRAGQYSMKEKVQQPKPDALAVLDEFCFEIEAYSCQHPNQSKVDRAIEATMKRVREKIAALRREGEQHG